MKRFTGEGEAPDRLDAILHERLADLARAREAEDRRIVAWIGGLDETRLKGVIRYRRVSTPDEFVQPLMPALDHWFNHQTHHRGQAHMILTSLGKKAPELDLLYALPAHGQETPHRLDTVMPPRLTGRCPVATRCLDRSHGGERVFGDYGGRISH